MVKVFKTRIRAIAHGDSIARREGLEHVIYDRCGYVEQRRRFDERPLNHPEERAARLRHAAKIAAEVATWTKRERQTTYRQDALQ